MRSSRIGGITTLAAIAALALAAAPAGAVTAKPHVPKGRTGAASHILTNSALLTGTIIPNGLEVTYWFVYGPTTAYGSQTTTGVVPATTLK